MVLWRLRLDAFAVERSRGMTTMDEAMFERRIRGSSAANSTAFHPRSPSRCLLLYASSTVSLTPYPLNAGGSVSSAIYAFDWNAPISASSSSSPRTDLHGPPILLQQRTSTSFVPRKGHHILTHARASCASVQSFPRGGCAPRSPRPRSTMPRERWWSLCASEAVSSRGSGKALKRPRMLFKSYCLPVDAAATAP